MSSYFSTHKHLHTQQFHHTCTHIPTKSCGDGRVANCHVIRMPDARLPKKVFYGELQEGKRSQGGQKKRYKDTLKASLKDFEIPMGSWEQTAQERSKWRGLINKGAALYEKKRICEAERKRRERKAKTNVPPSDSMTLTCSTCNRQFRARIGLVSHQRTHQHTSALFKK